MSFITENDIPWNDLILSPRAHVKKTETKLSISCCKNCYNELKKDIMPKFAIANGYQFGTPPQCMLELTDVELALLSPISNNWMI